MGCALETLREAGHAWPQLATSGPQLATPGRAWPNLATPGNTWQDRVPQGDEGTHPTPKVPQNMSKSAKTQENTVNETIHFCGGSVKKTAAKQFNSAKFQ